MVSSVIFTTIALFA